MRLSIVLGTWNRLRLLQRCVQSVHRWCDEETTEIIVVDGGSTDGTVEWLTGAGGSMVRLILQRELLGAVKAFNPGFARAQGTYVANLNDDAYLVDDALNVACVLLGQVPRGGQVAIPFGYRAGYPDWCHVDYTLPLAGKRWLYANFGVTRKELGDSLGWWGHEYYTYGGDTELSMKIWNAGYQVVALDGYAVIHDQVQDALRRPNWDSDKFYAKWRSWNGPGDVRPEFTGEVK